MATRISLPAVLAVLVLAGAALATVDLHRQQARTIVVYTTPALKDVLEKDIIPRFQNATGERVEPVYVAAGEQYNRLRLSGLRPEADVFLHASPLYIEKGYHDGYFEAFDPGVELNDSYRSESVDGGRVWAAFAWSPLVEVYAPNLGSPPDLATSDVRFGLADPLLSNNGVYNVLYFEKLDVEAGRHVLERTTLQPVNSAATIGGITDGSFDATLGYEAVALLYQHKGAKVEAALPVLHGNTTALPVVMSAGLVKHHAHPDAARFLRFLFTNETQSRLSKTYLRPVQADAPLPKEAIDLQGQPLLDVDWSAWADLEAKLPLYVVKT